MKNKFKPPYIFILILCILIVSCLVWLSALFLRDYFMKSIKAFILFCIVFGGICVLFGSVWVSSAKDWNLQEFSEGLNTIRVCDHVVFLAEQRKSELKKRKVE